MTPVLMKLVRLALVFGGVMLVMRLAGPKIGEFMDRKFEEAPDDFPPKWMYLNISAIREQNERILQLMEKKAGVEAA
ncbi:MAG: hypothetical protein OEP52_02575 [Acidimicrobiia bacterium]|nr:hypothetical protein [Acidimicrobiia bacterium]